MNLYWRFLILVLKNLFFKPEKIDIFSICTTRFRVNPFDLDLNFHMNNGRYLSLMDLGRMDLMMQAQVFTKLFRLGYYPVVVSESIRFKRSLEFLETFSMKTQIESWDEKDFYIRQEFWGEKDLVAVGYIKGRFRQRGRKGSVPTPEIFEKIDRPMPTPQKSDLALSQTQTESLLIPQQNQNS